MKQRIEPDQLTELTPEQQKRLREWWQPQEFDVFCYDFYGQTICKSVVSYDREKNIVLSFGEYDKNKIIPLLSIGQCIQLLKDNEGDSWVEKIVCCDCTYGVVYESHYEHELIDALWAAIKEVL